MDRSVLKSIIVQKQESIKDVALTLRPMAFEDNASYVLVGIRRAGKSYMLYQDIQQKIREKRISPNGFLYINFEDERLSSMVGAELGEILEAYFELFEDKKPFIYLDEIQNIAGWEKFVRRLTDEKYRVMVTGSNARMLSGEIATTLGGRFIIREVFPFTFAEYISFQGISLEENWQYNQSVSTAVARYFSGYFYNGGFAEAFNLQDKREWINGLFQKILLGDIIERNAFRGSKAIRMLARKLADCVLQPVSVSRLQHIINSSGEKISLPTLTDYIDKMQEAYLIFSLPNYASPMSEQMTLRKHYYLDNGLLNNFLFEGETKLLENLVAITLFKKYQHDEEQSLFYYKKNIEVDFYIPEEKLAVQACYDILDDDTTDREINALVALNKVFPLHHAVIVTRDLEQTIIRDGLKVELMPIWKWLLQEN